MTGHAESPQSLDAIGRGMMKSWHPHEIRIPDILNSFSSQCSRLDAPQPSNDPKPLRGRGRGSQLVSSQGQRRLSSREKRVGQTLGSQQMDIQEGKGFIMERFLGLHSAHHLRLQQQGANSQSSGVSRKTCPAKLGIDHLGQDDWPDLRKTHSGTNSLQKKKTGNTGSKGLKPGQDQSTLRIDTKGNQLHRSSSDSFITARNVTPERSSSRTAGEAMASQEKFDESSSDSRPLVKCKMTIGDTPLVAVKNTNETGNIDSNNCDRGSGPSVNLSHDDCIKTQEPNSQPGAEAAGTDSMDVNGVTGACESQKGDAGQSGRGCYNDTDDAKGGANFSLSDVGKELKLSACKRDEVHLKNGDSHVVENSGAIPAPMDTNDSSPVAPNQEENGEVNYKLFVAQDFQPGDLAPLGGPNVLLVEGLPLSIEDEDVRDLFFSCGTVSACKVLRDAHTKQCIGVAYVRLEESGACAMAVSSFNDEPSPFAYHHEDGEDIPCLKVQLLDQS